VGGLQIDITARILFFEFGLDILEKIFAGDFQNIRVGSQVRVLQGIENGL
jgi:hypothetical protein